MGEAPTSRQNPTPGREWQGQKKGPFFQQGDGEGVPDGEALELSFLGGQKRRGRQLRAARRHEEVQRGPEVLGDSGLIDQVGNASGCAQPTCWAQKSLDCAVCIWGTKENFRL